jgi:hypothetical protein
MQGKFGDLIHGDNDDQNGQLAEAVCRSDLIRLCTFFGKRKSRNKKSSQKFLYFVFII